MDDDICEICGGTGWLDVLTDGEISNNGVPHRRIERCDTCMMLPDDSVAEAAAEAAGFRYPAPSGEG